VTSYLTPIRWRDDTGWEYRCGDCAAKAIDCFWPLTDEFWDRKRTMRRCRSCQKNRDARRSRELYRKSPQYRENQRRAAKRYAEETVDARRIYERQRWQDVKEMDEEDRALVRAKAAARQRAYRARKRAAAGLPPPVEVVVTTELQQRRARKREWMRAKRAAEKAA
jgi:hypothetical protein